MKRLSTLKAVFAFLLIVSVLASCGGETSPAVAPTATSVPAAAVSTNTSAPVAAVPTDTSAPVAVAPTDTAVAAAVATDTPAAAAEASPTRPKPVASRGGTLTIWADAGRVPILQKLGEEFTQKYNVPVVVQELGFGDVRDQLKIAGPVGEGPDIIVGAHDWLGELVSNGLLEPIDLGSKQSSFEPVAIQAFSYNGKLYGMPYNVEAIALVYNKDLVPTPPATWDELKATAKRLQDEGKVEQGYVLQQADPYHSYPIFTGFGGYVFGRDSNGSYNPQDVGLDSAGGKAAAEELDAMIKSGLLRKDVDANLMNTMFQSGKSAMMFTGPWAIPDLKKAKVNFGVAKIPMMKQKASPFVGVQGYMISAFGKNKLLAQTFLTEYIATDEAMAMFYEAVPNISAWLPQRAKIANDPNNKELADFAASAADGQPMPAIPQMSAVWEAWTKAITLIYQQQDTPDKAIEDAAKTIREKIASSK